MQRRNVIGWLLVKWRQEKGWTQDMMATRLQLAGVDVSREVLANMECGRTQVTDRHLMGFQKALRLPINRLFPAEVRMLDEKFAQDESKRSRKKSRHRKR